nr:hypothetical protein Hi04_10k_c5801_00019 [uncultured bacterium]
MLALLLASPAQALDRMDLSIGRIQSGSWQMASAQLQIDLDGSTADMKAVNLQLPPPIGIVHALRLHCAKMQMDDAVIACDRAQFHVENVLFKPTDFIGGFSYRQADGLLQFMLPKVAFGGGVVKLEGKYGDKGWQLVVVGQSLLLANLLKSAGTSMKLPEGLTLDGSSDLSINISGGAKLPTSLNGELALKTASLNTSDGKWASDKLTLSLNGSAQESTQGWSFEVTLASSAGQAYVEPVFLDFAQAPVRLTARGGWSSDNHRLALEQLQVDQKDTLQASGSLSVLLTEPHKIESASLAIDRAQLPGVYTRYAQPFLLGTSFDSLETEGVISGSAELRDNAAQDVALKLQKLQLDDSKRRFALYGASGNVHWNADGKSDARSELQWEGGSGYRVNIGAAAVHLQTAGKNLKLLQPVRIPLLDGALQVQTMALDNAGQPDMHIAFNGKLEPVGMEGLCTTLGWPVFSGTLAGTLPTAEYRDGVFSVSGALKADVFGGQVEVNNLRLDQPFSTLPKLAADMKLRKLDLESVTSAFSFGRIEGRLDGDVNGLRLLNWQPVAFDGRLYTTPGDKSNHRISQRAIENISNLGGSGASGVLSRGFLRFFKDFAYDRLALGCRLQDGVCHMSGLEPAPPQQASGYYIVKGRLVPRIDVIGFATEVNWDGFLAQLKSVTQSSGPVVK